MISKRKPVYLILFILFTWFYNTHAIAQKRGYSVECPNDFLNQYADTLDDLLLEYKPREVIELSDSIISPQYNQNCLGLVRVKSKQAKAYEFQYKFEEAVAIYNEILRIAEKNKYYRIEVDIRLSLAAIFEAITRPELCIEQLELAKEIIDKYNLQKLLSTYYVRYSSYLRFYSDDKAKAREFAQLAIEKGKEQDVINSVTDGYLLVGILSEDFDESIEYYQKASDAFYKIGNIRGGIAQDLNIATRYYKNGNYQKALDIIKKADAYNEVFLDNERIYYEAKSTIAQLHADIYERTGEKDKQIDALKKLNEYSDLFGFLVNQEHINQLLLDDAIEDEKEKIKASEKRNDYLIIGLIGLSIIIVILSRLYWLNYSKKQKIQSQTETITTQYKELEDLYHFKSTLLNEVHHRIKNNLQLIISLITLQNAKTDNRRTSEILEMLNHRIRSIALIHEQLYNSEEFQKVNVEIYIKNLFHNFISLSPDKEIIVNYETNDIEMNLETITPLGLIWSELISNSIKYNEDQKRIKLSISLKRKDNIYQMHYYDNGIGYSEGEFESNNYGMGYTIIQNLSRQLAASSDTYNDNGAHYTLTFKEKTTSPL